MARTLEQVDMDKIVSLSKRRGFVFPSSDIYGGLGSTWDYGPLGVELKRNVKDAWWRAVVHRRDDVVGLDAAILMHPQTWVASGHVQGFADPFSTCTVCGRNHRTDQVYDAIWESPWWQSLLETMKGGKALQNLLPWARIEGKKLAPNLALVLRPDVTLSWLADLHNAFSGVNLDFKNFVGSIAARANGISAVPCPSCGGELSEPSAANLMLETSLGPIRATAQTVYLRPETAQGIFVNFQNVVTSTRRKLPFGIAQIGKAFRNEITPGNFVFRTREFEQMEIEFFVKPDTDEEWHQRWLKDRFQWYVDLGIRPENLRIRQHGDDELAHYAKSCYDIEYHFPWGWAELEGIANRTDFDLRQHQQHSGQEMTYFDDEIQDTNEKHYFPYVIEPSGGADRATLAFLVDSYDEETLEGDTRTVLHLHPALAPVKVAILPLSRNARLVPKAREVYDLVRSHFVCQYDDAQSIGRRYRRQDEIGTPMAVTVDFQTIDEDNAITIRDRDTMTQVRVPIPELVATLKERLER